MARTPEPHSEAEWRTAAERSGLPAAHPAQPSWTWTYQLDACSPAASASIVRTVFPTPPRGGTEPGTTGVNTKTIGAVVFCTDAGIEHVDEISSTDNVGCSRRCFATVDGQPSPPGGSFFRSTAPRSGSQLRAPIFCPRHVQPYKFCTFSMPTGPDGSYFKSGAPVRTAEAPVAPTWLFDSTSTGTLDANGVA